jgi:hypothetical protein
MKWRSSSPPPASKLIGSSLRACSILALQGEVAIANETVEVGVRVAVAAMLSSVWGNATAKLGIFPFFR